MLQKISCRFHWFVDVLWAMHEWYDRLHEPRRLLYAMSALMVGIVAVVITQNIFVEAAGFLYIGVLCMSRVHYLYGRKK